MDSTRVYIGADRGFKRGGSKKLIAWVRWLHGQDGYGGPDLCRQCRENRGEPTRCPPCDEPVLMPENREAVAVFSQCATQWRVGMNGATGMDYAALRVVMALADVADERACFDKVRILESEQLKIWHGNKN